jgi:hypothetical protein
MVSGRVYVLAVAVTAALAGCQGRTTSRGGSPTGGAAGAASGGSAGESTGGSAGTTGGAEAGQGGAQAGGTPGGSGTGATGGDAGRSGSPGSAGSAGSGWTTTIPNPSDDEKELLAPLGTDDATIDGTSGTDLTSLGRRIGTARGYAMCRCAFSPDMPPEDPNELDSCVVEETGLRFLTVPSYRRCIDEGMAEVPGFEDYVRCQLKWIRDDGKEWQTSCVEPTVEHVWPDYACPRSPEVSTFIDGCALVYYCADGARVAGSRCNATFECTDQSDELGCFAERGKDWFWCDGTLVEPGSVCRDGDCGVDKVPPVCDTNRPEDYLCNDGSVVRAQTVCDRVFDCPDGSDERYCVK